MAKDYIFERKGIFTEDYLSPKQIREYESLYGDLIGVESDGILIKAEKGRKDGINEQGDSGEI